MNPFINLIPPGYQRRALLRLRVRQWGAVWALAAALAAMTLCGAHFSHDDAPNWQFQANQREEARVQQLQKRITETRARLSELEGQEERMSSLADAVPPLAVLGVVSRAARQSAGSLHVADLLIARSAAPPGMAASGATTTANRRRLLLRGNSVDGVSVAEFAAALRECGMFTQVDLKSATAEGSGATAGDFLVEGFY